MFRETVPLSLSLALNLLCTTPTGQTVSTKPVKPITWNGQATMSNVADAQAKVGGARTGEHAHILKYSFISHGNRGFSPNSSSQTKSRRRPRQRSCVIRREGCWYELHEHFFHRKTNCAQPDASRNGRAAHCSRFTWHSEASRARRVRQTEIESGRRNGPPPPSCQVCGHDPSSGGADLTFARRTELPASTTATRTPSATGIPCKAMKPELEESRDCFPFADPAVFIGN